MINYHYRFVKLDLKPLLTPPLEVKSPATQWSKFRDLIHTVFGIGVEEKVEQECANRCLIHPSNRYTCGKARSQDQCDAVGCCWDENSQHCYKEACKYTNNIQLFVKRVYTTSSSCTTAEFELTSDTNLLALIFWHSDWLVYYVLQSR